MNKNVDENKAESPILLQKNSECRVRAYDIYKSVLNSKGLNEQNIEINLDSNADVKYTMSVFWFMKSPDLDDGKGWHLNHYAEYKIPRGEGEGESELNFRSVHKVNGHNKLVRTSELMFMIDVHQMESSQFEEFAADIKNYDSETQIKTLEKAGYERFTAQDGKERGCGWGWRGAESPYEVCGASDFFVDGNAQRVSFSSEYYREPHNYGERDKDGQYISTRSEYINPAHMPKIVRFPENAELNSVIILNKNAEMKYCGDNDDESPFCKVKNESPLTFYCKPGSQAAIEILSECRDARKYHGSENKREYPEFCNATIVFMSPKLVADYQKNLDDVDNYREMKEFIKPYKENEDYFSFNLSECSNRRIEQLLLAQTNFSDTWEVFVKFMEDIGVKEKSNVEKDVEHANESTDKNDTIGASDDQNQNKKNIKFINDDKKEGAGIGEVDNKSENESKLKYGNKTLTQNYNLGENVEKELTQNVEIKKTDENKDNKIGEPEEHLCSFMRYLKNHWPRIFKFLNAVCNFFSWFKSKFKSNDKNSLGDTGVDNRNPKQSLIDKTSNLSLQKNIVNRPNNMKDKSVDNALQ